MIFSINYQIIHSFFESLTGLYKWSDSKSHCLEFGIEYQGRIETYPECVAGLLCAQGKKSRLVVWSRAVCLRIGSIARIFLYVLFLCFPANKTIKLCNCVVSGYLCL